MSINYNSLALVANGQLTIKTLLFISVYCIYMYNNILHVIIEYAFTDLITITLMHLTLTSLTIQLAITFILYWISFQYSVFSLLLCVCFSLWLCLCWCLFLCLSLSPMSTLFLFNHEYTVLQHTFTILTSNATFCCIMYQWLSYITTYNNNHKQKKVQTI